ncbi:MAG: hypothetical protein ACREEP_17555 [Dongiaceae bacterium]
MALPLLPLFLWQIWLGIDQSVPSTALYLTAKGVGYAYSWILFPFVILTAARLLGRDSEGAGCIAPYNWTNVLWTILQLPSIALVALGTSPDLAAVFDLLIFIASLAIEGFLLMLCLRIAVWQAAVLVVIDVALGQALIGPISARLGGALL